MLFPQVITESFPLFLRGPHPTLLWTLLPKLPALYKPHAVATQAGMTATSHCMDGDTEAWGGEVPEGTEPESLGLAAGSAGFTNGLYYRPH